MAVLYRRGDIFLGPSLHGSKAGRQFPQANGV
jgi:hypothetical protein